jgi:hypothetical protein
MFIENNIYWSEFLYWGGIVPMVGAFKGGVLGVVLF